MNVETDWPAGYAVVAAIAVPWPLKWDAEAFVPAYVTAPDVTREMGELGFEARPLAVGRAAAVREALQTEG